ncbi:MAG: hypothetical protein ACI9UU_003622 [Candidatus Azotimanducaceae bacterium]|jgi:uncharacterized protein (DUF3820 family)
MPWKDWPQPPDQPTAFALEEISEASINRELLEELIQQKMPYGRFAGTLLIDLPEPYVVWFKTQGFPPGKLGNQLATLYEIKRYGLESLLRPLLRKTDEGSSDTD